ncbi:MAG TPA: chemotaxis protein CheA [Longimicrobiales bacterium]|nr:chemotaxis protein CheA [Longimicrobiales bacterium]
MDLRRFLDLFVSEAQEHVRLLHRSLLALEAQPDGAAVAEAFRAAHTLKGIAAAMGYTHVADLAHRLEDQLEELRAGRRAADATLVDALLVQADVLEAAIQTAVATVPVAPDDAAAPPSHQAARPRVDGEIPDSTAMVALVRLRPDAPIKSARAMLIMRALDGPGVLGSDPAEFTDDFDGNFRIFFDAAADVVAAEATIAAAGEVASVELVEPAHARPAVPGPATPAPAARQLRVDAARLDRIGEGIGELSVLYGRLGLDSAREPQLQKMLDRLGRVLGSLQHDVLALRMVPVREVFERLPRVVRDSARTLGKEVDLAIEGDDVELDRAILEEISDPLIHLLRNAVDHGIGTPSERLAARKHPKGQIILRAERERNSVRIVVEDDGRGIVRSRVLAKAKQRGLLDDAVTAVSDEELFRLLSHAGLSTADEVSSVSGRGVGMDVVATRVRALGGAIEMHTLEGAGTTFSIRLPITLALAQALRVRVGGEDYAIPLTHLTEAVALSGSFVDASAREMLQLRTETMPLVRLRRVLQIDAGGSEQAAVIAEMGDRRAALAVDELVGREQILVKGFDPVAGMLPYFSGATLLANGRPALVLDPLSVI